MWLRRNNNNKSAITTVQPLNKKRDGDEVGAPNQLLPNLQPCKKEEQELHQRRRRRFGVREWEDTFDGRGTRRGQEVNMALMVKSRIIIPVLYLIFNIVYWAIALT